MLLRVLALFAATVQAQQRYDPAAQRYQEEVRCATPRVPSWPISPSDRCCCALFQMMRQQMLRQQQQQGQQQQQYARAAQQQQAQQDALLRAQVQSLGSHNPPKIRHPVYPMPLHRSARR